MVNHVASLFHIEFYVKGSFISLFIYLCTEALIANIKKGGKRATTNGNEGSQSIFIDISFSLHGR